MDRTVTERRTRVRKYKNKGNRPDRQRCYEIMREHGTPDHVVRHCEAVCDTAMKIARELNRYGYELDMDLIQAAALVHDVARVEDRHWDVGADIMQSMGYEDEADIVRAHMFYPRFSDIDDLTETDIVCLGDRTVREDKYVGLEERIEYIISKIPGDESDREHVEHVARIRAKMQDSRRFIDGIEKLTGKSIDEIVSGNR